MNLQNPSARNIITLSEYQEYSKNTDMSLSGFLQNNISRASSWCEGYCNKGLKLNNYVDFYDGDGTNTLLINQYPIISVSSLQYQISPTSTWQNFYPDSLTGNILYDNSKGIITLYDNAFPSGINNIKIEYTAGFSDCPQDLKEVVLEMCSRMYDDSKHGTATLSVQTANVGTGGFSTSISYGKLEDKWKFVLNNYRRGII